MNELAERSQPGLRAAQTGSSAPDDLARSINLFRGQVVLPLELVSLPGRNGLDVGVCGMYSSAVAQQVGLRNRDAPTSTLGVGWSLAHERIVLGDRLVALAEQQRAFLVDSSGVQALYRVEQSGARITFQTREYQFWKIELIDPDDPARSRWRVTREDGSIRLFGLGDAREWGAAWDSWVGPSTAGGANQFPVAWNLAEISSPEGDRISFAYERDELEIGGVATTRAARLARIVNVFGRSVEFDYREKQYFENELPERPPAWATPAYQFSFQTRYLNSITVRERHGEIAFRQLLDYKLLDVGAPPEQARPEFTKRYLTSVRQELPGEQPLAAITLSYESNPDAAARGALIGQTFVTGARASYAYSSAPVPHSSTELELDGPPEHRPCVWHGPSFTVITWYAQATGRLELWVCAWSGVWRVWREDTLVNVEAVSVVTGSEFFAIRYHDRARDLPAVRLYHEDPHRFGTWNATDVSVGPELAELRMACGTDFIALQGQGNAWMRIVSWDALRKRWHEQTLDTPSASQVALGGGDNFLLGAFHSDGSNQLRLQVFFADHTGQWRAGGYTDVTQPVDWELTSPDSVWSSGSALGAATLITGVNAGTVSATVILMRWRADYALADVHVQRVTQPTDARNPLLYSTLVEALVGHAADVMRFDAGAWNTAHLVDPQAGGEYRYAYGSDLALLAELRDGRQRFGAQRYDPYSARWSTDGAPPPSELNLDAGLFAPAIAGVYALLGRSVYSRTAEGVWERVHDLPENTLGESCALRSGGYLCYQRRDQPSSEIVFFENGIAKPEILRLPGERSFVPNARAGEVLAGPSTLVTYRGDTFASARTLTLRRVIDAAMPTQPLVPVIAEATLDDGYTRRSMRPEYEQDGAALDPTASTVQFTRVGVRWPSDPERGSTLHTFYNGLEPDDLGAFYPPDGPFSNARRFLSLLSGQIWKSETLDATGDLVSRVATLSWVYDRAAGPAGSIRADSSEEPDASNLAGFYTRARRTERTLVLALDHDGADPVDVIGVETYDYNSLGQISITTAFNLAPDGTEEQLETLTTYAWELYEPLREAHILTPVAQTQRRNALNDTITGIDVTTYVAHWPSVPTRDLWAARDAYRWRGQQDTAPFDFAAWSELEQAPPGWLLESRVVDRSPTGAILEQRDVDGVPTSAILDRDDLFEVARLHASSRSVGEGWYWGFEAYENPGPWTMSAPAALLEGTAFAGRRCLRVPGSPDASPSLTTTLHCGEHTRSLMLACRSHTARGSGHEPLDAVWRVRAGDTTREFAARASDGAWRLWHVPLHPADFAIDRFTELDLELINREPERELLLDCLFCNPLIGAAQATVYSEPHELEIARVPRLAAASWTLFDDLRRPIAEVGESCVSTTLATTHMWPAIADTFDPARPNFDLQTRARTAGAYLNAVHGDSYLEQWTVTGSWQRDVDVMRHTGNTEGQILTQRTRSEPTFALRARIQPEGDQPQPYGLELGGARVLYHDGRWALLDPGGSQLASAPAASPPERDLLVLATDVGVQLYGEGRPLIDAPVGPLAHGPLGVFASGTVRVSQLLAADGVSAEASFRDNLMRPIQEQAVRADGVTAVALLLDGGARPAVRTRPLERAGQLLGLMGDLVRSFDWDSGLLEGAVADGYPADEGYPYGRERYDPTPLARPLETGLPGRALAIDERVPIADRHTQRTLYEATGPGGGALALASGWFSVTVSIDQDGVRTRRALDRLGRPVREMRDNVGDPTAQPELRAWEYDEAGRLHTLWLPNSFDSSRPDAERFRERFTHDFLGRLIERAQPDMDAPAQSVYDDAGRVRFAVDGGGLAHNTFTYCRYDELGRLLEDGVCPGPWDRATLQAGADDRNWLPAGAKALNLRSYDGDGEDPHGVGQLVQALAQRPDTDGAQTHETFRYDRFGRLLKRAQTVTPDGGGTDTVDFAYDLQGATIEQRHSGPEDTAFTLYTVRDPEGQVVRLQGRAGTRPAEPFAAYEYTAEGQLHTETLAPASPTPLERRYSYGPAGWLSDIQDACFSQRVHYDGSFAGRVTATEERFADPPPIEGFLAKFQTTISHDAHGRLLSVANSAGESYGLGTVQPLSYDRNGNLLSFSRGPTIQRHVYAEGTNRLVEVAGVGTYAYDNNGAVRAATPLSISSVTRHPTTNLPLTLDLSDGASVAFGYAANGRRVLERNGTSIAVTIHDPAGRPIARRMRAGERWRTIHYLHGPTGLAAAHTDQRSLFVLRDRLGSVRGVYDGARLVAAASYQPLGDALGARWIEPQLANLLPQGFTGQQQGPPDGLVLFPARMYDPLVARFDRIDPAARHPSPYAYAGGAPLDFVDPDGEDLMGALLGILVGAVLIIGGGAAIFFSGGAATPGVAAAWGIGAGFLLGAGAQSVAYGLGQATTSAGPNMGEWAQLTALGGLFGALSGGVAVATTALATQAAITAARAFAFELGLGVVTGTAEGFISNGIVNVNNGRDFDDRWGTSVLSGFVGGAISGGTGGFMGRMVAVKNARTLVNMRNRNTPITVHQTLYKHWPVSHSAVTTARNATYNQVADDANQAVFRRWNRFNPNYDPNDASADLIVNRGARARANSFAEARAAGRPGAQMPPEYSYLSNSCVTNVIAVIEQTGLTVPPWAYSPTTLRWWVNRLPR